MSSIARTAATALCLAVLAALLFAPAAGAQSIIDARRVEFIPSAEHALLDASGAPLLQRYTLGVFVVGAALPLATADLGKPDPDTDGLIRLDFVSRLSAPLLPGVTYEAVVSAVGPSGVSASLASNTFGFSGPCAPSLAASAQTFPAAGGQGTVAVTAGTGCGWTASSSAGWLTVTGGATGAGNGTVAFTAAATTAATTRVATLTIAGTAFTVTQSGVAGCATTISPASQSAAAAGGTATVTVTAGAGCAWTASSSAAWAPVIIGAAGSGPGTVRLSLMVNTTASARTATVMVAGQSVSIVQSAACSVGVGSLTLTIPAGGATATLPVTTQAGCAWSASANTSWLTVSGGGTGSGTAAYTVAPNASANSRSGTLVIGGQSVVVTQAAFKVSSPVGLRILGSR